MEERYSIRSARQCESFFADFLLEISKAILQQQFLNFLIYLGKGINGLFGNSAVNEDLSTAGVPGDGIYHRGGIVGVTPVPKRQVDPRIFLGARRFHEGGLPGLKQNEIPAILERGEQVIPKDQVGRASNPNITIVNGINAEEVVEAGLSTPAGTQTYLNWIGANRTKVKAAMGI